MNKAGSGGLSSDYCDFGRLKMMNNKQYLALAVTLSLTGYSLDEYTAKAAIPDEEGIFTGCVSKFGSIRLIDTDNMRCSRTEKKVTWSQSQNVPVSGPIIVDAKGQLVGSLLQHVSGVAEGGIGVNYAGIPINGDYYWVLVSEDGFENSFYDLPFPSKDGKWCPWKYYESADCTGNFFLMYSGASAYPNSKYFSNYKKHQGNFVYDKKLYEYDASKVVWNKQAIEVKSWINACFDPNDWPGPVCQSGNYDSQQAFIPPDAYYEVADLTNYEPPFKLVVH